MAKEGKDKELDILLANKELKVGDKLVLGIPSDLKDINGNPVIVYYKVEDNNHIPVGIFTASGNLAKNIKSKTLMLKK